MDLDLRIKLIIAGLLVISLAGIYFIFSQRAVNRQGVVETPPVVTTPAPTVSPSGPPQVVGQNSNLRQNLPNTAFPTYLLGVFALSGAVTGFFLRKFPH
ncbi:MAG: hypothetical protein HYW45_01075 [Candidatus Daviesbacteria bacterium]|nr:MAG: hypothetical protein HYW45_01075 [Candidatus Daviesbacteria bacterium]